jgi:shikimate kinase
VNPRGLIGSKSGRSQTDGLAGHLVLVGLPGTGKSTVAPLLATVLDRGAIDLDSVVEQHAGCSVPDLFASVGEVGFRDLERKALTDTLRGDPVVLATGGGVVTTSEARRELQGCWVAWLRARTDTLVERLSGVGDPGVSRPLLDTEGPAALRLRIEELSLERSDLYEEVADVVVDVDDCTPTEVAQAILVELNEDGT